MSDCPDPKVPPRPALGWGPETRAEVESRLRYLARRRYPVDEVTAARLVRVSLDGFLRLPARPLGPSEQRQLLVSLVHERFRSWLEG